MWKVTTLVGSARPGDKGVGLRLLEAAGLPVPKTLVINEVDEAGDGMSLSADSVFAELGIRSHGLAILRPSLDVERDQASSISGLYDSIRVSRDSFLAGVEQARASYCGADRDIEVLMSGPDSQPSGSMALLVQPFVEPLFSGVAHLTLVNRSMQLNAAMVAGHLEQLVGGKSAGWEFQLTATQLDGVEDVVLIADERDLYEITALPGSHTHLASLYSQLHKLWTFAGPLSWEVEWTVDDKLWFLQCQPLVEATQ
jgi:hypothetical protein